MVQYRTGVTVTCAPFFVLFSRVHEIHRIYKLTHSCHHFVCRDIWVTLDYFALLVVELVKRMKRVFAEIICKWHLVVSLKSVVPRAS